MTDSKTTFSGSAFDNLNTLARSQWQRREGDRPLINQVYVSCEGVVTEPEYFERLRPFVRENYRLVIVKRELKEVGHSSPPHIRRKIDNYRRVRHIRLHQDDEQWLIFDVDSWTPDQFAETYRWAASRKKNFLGISNPSFEYWLLLHFEDPLDKLSCEGIQAQLRYYIPNYDKHMPNYDLEADMLRNAMDRARRRHWLEIGKEIPQKIARSAKGAEYQERWEKLLELADRYDYKKPEEMAEAAFSKENGSTVYLLAEHLVGKNPSSDVERSRERHKFQDE
ncbi:MAG: RloB family protein [Eubacteriales bacterium]|nr:RloB family protein [Eubacteriales bacterium]